MPLSTDGPSPAPSDRPRPIERSAPERRGRNAASLLRALRALVLLPAITLVMGSVAIAGGLLGRSGRHVHRLVTRPWAWMVVRAAGLRVRLSGLESLEAAPPYVVVMNHQSLLDIPLLVRALPFPLLFLGKAELSRVPVFAQALSAAGHLFIDRSNPERARRTLAVAEERMLRHGVSIVFAPEGTRGTGTSLGPFKKGAFVTAIETGRPILPVVLRGTGLCLPRGRLLLRGFDVEVEVLPPVPTTGRSYADRDALMEEVRGEMERRLGGVEG